MVSRKLTVLSGLQFSLLIALIVVLVNAAFNGQYGFHRDELDILMNARQPAWGYVAYPPVTPWIAALGLALFGPSLWGLRLFAALAQGVAAFLVMGMTRDFGGGRWAQVIAALAAAAAPLALTSGTLIQYMSFDYLCWVIVAFFFVRRLATGDPRWWIAVGAAIGLGMMTKYAIAFWVAGLVIAVLITPARRDLTTRWPWLGAGLALLIFLPNLLWQVQHGFISLGFLQAIHARDIAYGRSEGFFTDQFYSVTNPLSVPLWIAGLLFCLFSSAGKRFRALGWMYLITLALLAANQARGYYLAPAYPVLIAAGAAWLDAWLKTRAARAQSFWRAASGALTILALVVGILTAKPVFPIKSPAWDAVTSINETFVEMIGWPELVAQVAQVYRSLPVDEQSQTAVLAGNYGEAGALDLYGPAYDLPRVISGSNSLWARGYAIDASGTPPDTIILVGFESNYALSLFQNCSPAGKVTNSEGVRNEETTRHNNLYICKQPRKSWAELWKGMQWYQ